MRNLLESTLIRKQESLPYCELLVIETTSKIESLDSQIVQHCDRSVGTVI